MANNKYKVRVRPNRSKSKEYTFHSYGTYHTFNPHRIIEDDRIINEANEFERLSMLDFYKNEVRDWNASHVYILNERGETVTV